MSVRRLLVHLLLVGSLLPVPVPATAGPRTTAECARQTNAPAAPTACDPWPSRPP